MLRTTLISLAALAVVAGAVQAQPPAGAAGGAAGPHPGGGRGGASPGRSRRGDRTATAALRLPRVGTPEQYVDNPKGQGVGYELAVEAAVQPSTSAKPAARTSASR